MSGAWGAEQSGGSLAAPRRFTLRVTCSFVAGETLPSVSTATISMLFFRGFSLAVNLHEVVPPVGRKAPLPTR